MESVKGFCSNEKTAILYMTGSFAILSNGDYKASKFLYKTRTVTVMHLNIYIYIYQLVHTRCLVMGTAEPSKFLQITKYCNS